MSFQMQPTKIPSTATETDGIKREEIEDRGKATRKKIKQKIKK